MYLVCSFCFRTINAKTQRLNPVAYLDTYMTVLNYERNVMKKLFRVLFAA